jgi:hypothetical protein
MKKLLAILLACLLLVTAVACGAPAEEPEAAAPKAPYNPEAEEKAQEETPAEPEPVPEEPAEPVEPTEPEEPSEPAENPVEEAPAEGPVQEAVPMPTVEDALAFVDQPLSDLIEAIGEPLEEYYEYSCSGPGDDGLLTYDGFIVFTYREPDGSAEVVIDAEAE